nr:SUKH-4 family immunity protein [Micromonospora sp. DSM 115978]
MLKRKQLEKWFPDDELLVIPATALPPEISEPSTRKLLTEVGIPESFLEVIDIDTNITRRVATVDKIYERYGEEPPEGVGHLHFLGSAGQPFLALDGSTGQILQVHRRFGARPLASSLEAFLQVLGSVSGEVEQHQRKQKLDADAFTAQLATDTLKQLKRTDPAALPDAEPAWRELLADIAANAS